MYLYVILARFYSSPSYIYITPISFVLLYSSFVRLYCTGRQINFKSPGIPSGLLWGSGFFKRKKDKECRGVQTLNIQVVSYRLPI